MSSIRGRSTYNELQTVVLWDGKEWTLQTFVVPTKIFMVILKTLNSLLNLLNSNLLTPCPSVCSLPRLGAVANTVEGKTSGSVSMTSLVCCVAWGASVWTLTLSSCSWGSGVSSSGDEERKDSRPESYNRNTFLFLIPNWTYAIKQDVLG